MISKVQLKGDSHCDLVSPTKHVFDSVWNGCFRQVRRPLAYISKHKYRYTHNPAVKLLY